MDSDASAGDISYVKLDVRPDSKELGSSEKETRRPLLWRSGLSKTRLRWLLVFILLIGLGAGAFWWFSRAQPSSEAQDRAIVDETDLETMETSNEIASSSLDGHPLEIVFLRDGNIWLANEDGSDQKQITAEGNVTRFYLNTNTDAVVYSQIAKHYSAQLDKVNVLAEIKLRKFDDDQNVGIVKREFETIMPGGIEPHFDFLFGFSPDGQSIVFANNFLGEGKEGLVIYKLDTGEEKYLPEDGSVNSFVFSPDSKWLAVVRDYNIYIVSIDDFSRTQLTRYLPPYETVRGALASYESPTKVVAWPSEDSILYIRGNYGRGSSTSESTSFLYRINVSTLEEEQVSESMQGGYDYFLDFSSNGKDFYYLSSRRVFTDHFTIYRLAAGQEKAVAIDLPSEAKIGYASAWLQVAPAGQKVVYEHGDNPQSFTGKLNTSSSGMHEVWVMNVDGSNGHKVLDEAVRPEWKIK